MLLSLLLLQKPLLGEGFFSWAYGVLGEDVLLPCTFPAAARFNLQDLVVNWQRTDSHKVVHSFYSEVDHPEYQDLAFRGRTELFSSEFPKGNAALKLKGATASDRGNYTCYVVQEDGKGYIENTVELELLGTPQDTGTDAKDPVWKKGLGITAVILVLIGVGTGVRVGIWELKKKQQDSDEKAPLLGNSVEDAIQGYKEYVLKNSTDCSDKMSRSRPKDYSSLARTVNVTYPKEQSPVDDFMWAGALNTAIEVKATQLLSLPQTENCSLKRTLLVGDAGVGKSWAVASIHQEWASQSSQLLKCIIVFRFYDLNGVEGKTTLRELLKKQCEPLSSVLTELLRNPHDVLIILDGLDEFRHQLQWDPPDSNFNIDTEAKVNVLVSKIISRDLLPEAQVLVTSRWNTKQIESNKEYFDCILIISGFINDQLKKYCEVFYLEKERAAEMYKHFTENETITCLASNPLNSYILCNILDCCPQVTASMPITNSKVFSLFLYSLFNCSSLGSTHSSEEMVITIDHSKNEQQQKVLQDTVLKLGELSFNKLLSGKLEMNKDDLDAYEIDPEVLSEYFSNLISKKCKDQTIFEFHHVVLKEQFAALYCATSLNDDAEELVKCLDLWCFGETPRNQNSQFYLQSFQPEHTEKLCNFTRFLMGLLTTGRDGKLWNCTAPLTYSTARALITWFKNCLERDLKKSELLNLMRCLFELHDPTVTAEVSPRIKRVEFLNVSLSPLDISALCYCLSHSTVEELDLRLCTLGDDGIKQLKEVLFKCKTVLVSSNNLTVKSAEILSNILQDPKCNIETLSSGTNCFGSRGAQFFWKALAKNQSLKSLRLYDNGIADEGTENMIQYLSYNKTLEKLYLCVNEFGDLGQRNIQQVEELGHGLKIVTKIVEDEELLHRVEKQIQQLLTHSQEYKQEWLQKIMAAILKDLGDESYITDQRTKTRVASIRENINKLLCKREITTPQHLEANPPTPSQQVPHLDHGPILNVFYTCLVSLDWE
uniref:NACHT, LRR and PYD domains-containing protein 6-like n=1 Tax=Pristiophorus japonicus TaxID=55135 RepID=UPI00398F4BAF